MQPVDRPAVALGIESTCDETSIAIVTGDKRILANPVFGQADLHNSYGGVVPEIAARAHAERLLPIARQAFEQSGLTVNDIDLVSVAAGPGLIGGVAAGTAFAKGIAASTGKAFFAINHLEGHALTPRLVQDIAFPYLLLLVSGGHCQLLWVAGVNLYHRLGSTIDDAAGEAFDKIAQLLGLAQPGGPSIENEAKNGDEKRFIFPRPLMKRPGFDMSFSGLKTSVKRTYEQIIKDKDGITRQDRADICASFQQSACDLLVSKSARAMQHVKSNFPPDAKPIFAVAGGVAANKLLRAALYEQASASGYEFLSPPLELCGDNGAIVAWAGLERHKLGLVDNLSASTRPRWPLDDKAVPLVGSGSKGARV